MTKTSAENYDERKSWARGLYSYKYEGAHIYVRIHVYHGPTGEYCSTRTIVRKQVENESDDIPHEEHISPEQIVRGGNPGSLRNHVKCRWCKAPLKREEMRKIVKTKDGRIYYCSEECYRDAMELFNLSAHRSLICKTIKEHDRDLKDDPERLDISKFLECRCDDV